MMWYDKSVSVPVDAVVDVVVRGCDRRCIILMVLGEAYESGQLREMGVGEFFALVRRIETKLDAGICVSG